MPIPFPKLNSRRRPVDHMPMCSNCGEERLVLGNPTVQKADEGMFCCGCGQEYSRIGNMAYRSDELIDHDDIQTELDRQERESGVDECQHECYDGEPQRRLVVDDLRSMAGLFPDDNIVVLGDDLMTQLDMERDNGKLAGYKRGFRVGFVLGVIVMAIVGGSYLIQVVKELRGF